MDDEELTDGLREVIAAIERVDATRAQLDDELKARREVEASWRETVSALEEFVHVQRHGSAKDLADFGLRDRKKPGPKTNDAKLLSAKKAEATRAARGTKAKRRRKPVVG